MNLIRSRNLRDVNTHDCNAPRLDIDELIAFHQRRVEAEMPACQRHQRPNTNSLRRERLLALRHLARVGTATGSELRRVCRTRRQIRNVMEHGWFCRVQGGWTVSDEGNEYLSKE